MENQETKLALTSFNFFDKEQFETMQRVCKLFASSELVPDMYKASTDNPIDKAMANCMIAIEMSQRIGASPLMIMQNLVIIYGRPSWSSKFLIGSVNTCGRFNPLQYKFTDKGKLGKVKYTEYVWQNVGGKNKKVADVREFDGTTIDNVECIAFTTRKGDNIELSSAPVSIKMAIEEGWYTKAGSKWKTMPKQMLIYRAASFWTNSYSPETSMGMKTEYEVIDTETIDIPHIDLTKEKEVKENANTGEEMGFTETKEAEVINYPVAPEESFEPNVETKEEVKEATKTPKLGF